MLYCVENAMNAPSYWRGHSSSTVRGDGWAITFGTLARARRVTLTLSGRCLPAGADPGNPHHSQAPVLGLPP